MTTILSFEQYYDLHRKAGEPDHSFIRAFDVSNRAARAILSEYQREVIAKYDEKGCLRRQYETAVLRGEISPPSRFELLRMKAGGHSEKPQTQAAKRVLDRHCIRFFSKYGSCMEI